MVRILYVDKAAAINFIYWDSTNAVVAKTRTGRFGKSL